jgi:hypothetical protein
MATLVAGPYVGDFVTVRLSRHEQEQLERALWRAADLERSLADLHTQLATHLGLPIRHHDRPWGEGLRAADLSHLAEGEG